MDNEKIKTNILKIVRKYLDLGSVRIFLFGSRAAGYDSKWSDYDIGIEGSRFIPLRTIALINSELMESDLPVKVEVVDFRKVNKKFKEFALKGAKLWKEN